MMRPLSTLDWKLGASAVGSSYTTPTRTLRNSIGTAGAIQLAEGVFYTVSRH